MRVKARLAAWIVPGIIAVEAVSQQTVQQRITSQSFVVGVMVLIGVQVLLVLGLASRLQTWVDRRVDARMLADESVHGKHRADAYAHEVMRRTMTKEFHDDLDKLHKQMAAQTANHRDEMRNLTEIVRPIVEQNAYAMQVMAGQMRRRGPKDEEGGG